MVGHDMVWQAFAHSLPSSDPELEGAGVLQKNRPLIAQRTYGIEGIPVRDEALVPDDVKVVPFAGIVAETKVRDDRPVGVAVLDEPDGRGLGRKHHLRPEPIETSREALVAAREFHIVEAVVCGQVQVRRWIPGRPEGHGGLPSIEEPPGFDDYIGSKSITRGRPVPESGRREAVDPCRNRITLR